MSGKKQKSTGVLSDHVRKGQRLLPPILHVLGDKHAPYSWTRQLVPEVIWIWLLIDFHGVAKGASLAEAIGNAAAKASDTLPAPLYATLSSFRALADEQKSKIRRLLNGHKLEGIQDALKGFCQICPDNPLNFLISDVFATDSDVESFSIALEALYDRLGRPAALTLATVTSMELQQGKLKMPPHIWEKVQEDFQHISDYPTTERSKAAAASFRAGAPLSLMIRDIRDNEGFVHNEAWLKFFGIEWARSDLATPRFRMLRTRTFRTARPLESSSAFATPHDESYTRG